MTAEVSRKVKKKFGAPETITLVERVEKNDDLFRSNRELFLETVLSRVLRNVFFEYVNTHPWVKVELVAWNEFRYNIEVTYRNWVLTEEFDASKFYTDKAKFCEELDEFVCKMSDKFVDEELSGRPWWWKVDEKNFTYDAHVKQGDRIHHINVNLGSIKFRGGRWNWFIVPSPHRSDWPVKKHRQGVAKTLEEAKASVEAGWKIEVSNG